MADNDGKIAVCREQAHHIWRCMDVTATSPAYHVCASGFNLSQSPTSWELQWKSLKHGQKLSVLAWDWHGTGPFAKEHIERSQPGFPRSPRGHLSEWRQMHFVLPRSFARETALAGNMAVCQNLVPLVNIKIAGKWMFIPLKMVLIGIDPYPYQGMLQRCSQRDQRGS